MAIYDDTVKKYKQYLKDAQIEALMEKSRQYNRENAGNRADAVSQARSSYDTAYRGLQNMGLAGAKGTELTGEVPRLKTNIAGQFNRVNAQLYNREQQAVEALGGQYAAQTKAEQAAAAAARAAAASQAEAEEAAKRNAVGGLVTGAVSAALAGQTKQTNANTATLIPSKGQRIGMETAAKTRGTGGMVTGATAAAIAQQEFEQKKALAAMQALGIRRSKFASSPTQKTAAQTTVNALQSSQNAQQEYLSAMEMLRRAQAGAQKDPRAGSGVAYYADRVGEILSNATIPTEQRVQMAMEYLQADVDEKTSPLADRKAKEIIARAYGLKVPKSDETFDALYKASRSKAGGLGYGVGATYDKDAEIAFRQEQSNRAEYDYFIPAIANSIRYAGKKAEPEKGVNNDIYAIINGQLTSNYLTLAERKNNLPTPYQKKMQKFEFLTDEEKNAYNWLYKNKGLDKANEYAESLTPFLLERNNAYTQEEWTKVANKSWVGASLLSVPMAIGEVPAAIKKMGLGLYNTVSKDAKYIDTNDPTETMSTIRSTIRSASSQKILGLDKENHEPTWAQKIANFFYSAGMSTADSALLGLMAKFGGWRGITDVIFFSSSFGDKYKEAVASGANQQQAFNAAVASGAAETIFEHISIDKFLENFLSAPLKGATRVARFIEMLQKIGLQGLVEGSEEMFTGIANLFTDQLFLGELSENAKSRAAYIQEALANGLSQKDAEKQAEKRVVAETIQNIGLETLAGALSGGMFGIFGAGMNKVHFSEMGRRLRGDTNVYDQVIQNAKMLGGETAEMARNIEQAGSKATDSAIGELYNASYEATRKLLKTDNRDTAAVLLAGEKITESQAEGMLEESGDVLKEAGYDTSSAEALAASYNQRVEEVATAQKEAFDNRARDYNIKRAEEVYTDKEALRNVPLTLPTGVSPVQFAEAERNNFKSRTTIQSDGVELQLSLMDMDGRFTNDQKLERARKAMTAQAQRKLDMIGKISKALGMDVVVHDYMRGSNGYFGEDGKIHFVLSGHMSVARVAAHELTHQMQSVASEKYTVVRDQLIEDVGQDRFDRLLKRKAAQYGYNMESEQGRLACDEEVIAELCEGMLSDKDRLERFAERHTDTALTLRERLTKILNAIHATLKDTFGQNQNRISDMITDEKTADKWLDGLDEVLKKVQEKQQAKEFGDAGTKFSILEIVDGKKIAWVENSGLSRRDLHDYKKVAEYIGEHIGEAYTIIESGSKVYIGEDLPGEYTQSEYTRRLFAKNRSVLLAKNKATDSFGDMIEIAENRRWEKTKHTHNKDAKYGMYRYDTCFAFPIKNNAGKVVDVKAYDAELLIRNASNGKKYLYDIVNIKENTDYQLELQQRKSRKGGAMLPTDRGVSSDTMTQNGESVKGKFSLDEAYRKAVSSGNVQEQQKLVEQAAKEAGYTKLFYHGSKKGGGFTTFKNWQYFTENKQYAQRYAGGENGLYTTYVKMENPFDTRQAEARSLFNEARQELGLSKLQENGLPDWTDGYDLSEYIEENDLPYDSIILDEGGDMVNGKPVSRGLSYVIRNPEQIKSADAVTYDDAGNAIPLSERFNMGKKDIRYALDTDYYDYSRSFAQQIDDYVAGKFPKNDTFVLGKTPDIFQKVGLSALPMTMDQVHVDYALNGTKDADHLMGADLLKNLPSLLEKPVAIIESATHPDNSVMAIVKGEVNGKQVTAAVRVGGTGRQNGAIIDSNHVASSHGKGNAITKLLLDALKKENAGKTGVYYINKTEAQDLCARAGVQFPGSAAQDGLIHSIFDAGSPVNRKYVEQTETRQFKRWFGDSKVVDKKGAPRKLYHYTDGEFTVFDTGKSGSNQGMRLGDGIYLSTSPTEFSSYGKNRMELYATISNPFEMQLTDEQANAVLDKYASTKHDLNAYDGVYRDHAFAKLTNPVRVMDYLQEYAKDNGIKVSDILKDLGYDGVHDGMEWVAFESGQVKSATDNIGTFDRNNPDIRYSLDTEQLEKTVRAIDTKALEEGLQSMTLTSNVNSFTMKDPSRFFDAISKNNTELRDELHDIFEKPHSEATGKYARGIKDMQERVRNIAKEAGILSKDGKKFDKAASAAVQNYGEGYQLKKCTVEAKVVDADTVFINAVSDGINVLSGDFTLQEVRKNFGRENGDMIWEKAFDQAQKNSERGQKASAIEYESTTSPYKLTDLQTQFPRTWQKLVEADKAFREMYDEYIGNMNAMLREIYPNSFTKEDDTVAKIDDLVEKKKHRITDTEKAIAERMKSLGKVEAEMAAKKRTDTKAYDTLRRRQTALNEAIADLNEKKAGYNEDIAALAVKKNAIFELDKSGESLNRMHQLEYRQDYYHHFNEMSVGLKEAWNLILQGSNRDISPAVVGNTANSKAKTRWAGFFQQRKGGAYTADAVNGMLKYGALAEYKLAFDPLVAYLRDAEKKIRDVSDETNRNSLILYLNSWTNQIAGKSSDFDRLLTDRGVVGRNILNFLQKLNGRVIRNTLYFNARSAIVQISNISNAVSLVTNPKDWKNGVLCWSKAAKGDEMMQNIMSQSNFLASRFAGVEMIDTSTMAKAEKFANWMLSIADTISAKATWWAAYNQYVRDPNSKSIMSMPRKYESAVDYADDVTRRTHGGRGVGEKAPIMTSKLVSFFAPFQLEVNNTYQLLKENIKKKNALGIATMEATVFAMNAVFEAIVGSTVLPFDFIRALIDILFGAKDIQDDDDDDHKLASTFKLIGQRLGAETVSGLPYAGMIPQFLGEDTTEAVFGETDMTKYGNVNMGVGGAVGIGKVLASLAKWGAEGVKPDWFSMVNELSEVLPPIGGKQIARTIGGLTTVAQGYSGKTNSKGKDTVQFATDRDILELIHAGIFGKWALTEASEYFGEDRILPKLFGYYNGESASAGSPVKAEEFQAARALGLSGKGYFTIRKELKGYRTQEGKRSSLYTTNLTPAQKAGMDALLICTTGTSSEAKSEGAIVYGRTKQEDGSWGEWKVKADYSSEDLFKLSLYGDTKYSAGTTALKNGAGIKNVLSLLDTVDAYNDANEKPMTATQKRDWLHQNVKDTKQAALLDAYILSKNKSTNVKVEGNVVYTMSLGEDGKPSVANDGTEAEWKVKADYTDDTWYAISQHGDSKYQKGLTAVRKGANPKTIRKYLDDMQAYQDSHKNQSMSSEERGQWIRKNGGTPKEQAILDAYMLRKDSNTDAKVKDGIVYTLELGEDGKPKVYKSGSVAEWKVKADYTSDEWYAASQTDYYNKAKTAYSACGIKPTVFVDFYTKWSDLSAKDASGKTVSGLKKKRTKELLDKMKISTEQKAYLYYKVCGYK